jgi:hypothetical protein
MYFYNLTVLHVLMLAFKTQQTSGVMLLLISRFLNKVVLLTTHELCN